MNVLLWNLLLALTWVAMTSMSAANLALGFLFGYLVLWLTPGLAQRTRYFKKTGQAIRFTGFFLYELGIATARVTYDVLTPTHYMRPSVLAIPLDVETDAEIATLAILITLTPGTLALDVSSDRKTLYIHAMYVSDPEAIRREIKRGFERRVMELLR